MEKGLRIMKVSSIFKYIFIIFAVGIIAYAGYRIYNNQNKEESYEKSKVLLYSKMTPLMTEWEENGVPRDRQGTGK